MKRITLLFCLLTASLGFSQVVLEDFEGTAPTVSAVDGASASLSTTQAIGTTSLEIISNSAGQPWQQAELVLQENWIDLTTVKTASVDVYSETAFNLLIKVIAPSAGGPESATSDAHGGTGWETLNFDFSAPEDGTQAANDVYTKILFLPNWDGTGSGTSTVNANWNNATNATYYVDNITGIASAALETCSDGILNNGETEIDCGGPNCDECPPADPAAAANPLNYTTHLALMADITDTSSFSNFWNPSYYFGSNVGTPDLDPTAAVNKAVKMDFSIAGWGGGINDGTDVRTDVSMNDMVHIDYYAPNLDAGVNGHAFYLALISRTAGGANSEIFYDFAAGGDAPIVFDAWQSVEIPLSAFVGFASTEFFQFKIGSPSDLNTTLVYFDNIYFYDSATLSTNQFETVDFSVYPNPTKNNWNIKSNTTISSITVYDILGKQVSTLAPNASNAEISTDNITAGIYFARIDGINGSSKTVKLIKE